MGLLPRRTRAPLLVGATWLLFFSPALLAGRVFFVRDLFFFHEPLRRAWISALLSGTLPFLDTALNLGQPVLANPNNQVFYPGNILFLLLPFTPAWNLFLAGHVLWAGLGLYWLSRTLGCEPRSALCGAFAFAFGGPLVSSLNACGLLVAASWLPWVLGLGLRVWREGGRWTGFAASALAALLLAGEPTVTILAGSVLSAGWLWGLARPSPGGGHWRPVLFDRGLGPVEAGPGRASRLIPGLLILVLAAVLAGAQLVPTLLWLPHGERGEGLPFRQSAAWWSLHPQRLIELLDGRFHGDAAGGSAAGFWGGSLSDSGLPYLLQIYSGWLPLVLAPLAARRRYGRPALLAAAAGLLLSLGHHLPGYHALYEIFPPLWFVRYPEKFLLLYSLSVAVCCALGVEELRRLPFGSNRATSLRLLVLPLALLALLLGGAALFPHTALTPSQRAAQIASVGQAAVVGGLSTVLALLAARPRWKRIAAPLLPAALLLDLAGVTWGVAGTRPREDADRLPRLVARLPAVAGSPILHAGEDRMDLYFAGPRDPFLSLQDALHPFTGLRWGVSYGAANDIDRMGWRGSAGRIALHGDVASPANLAMMREIGIGRIVTLERVVHPDLVEEASIEAEGGPPVMVYRLSPPPLPFVRWEPGAGAIHWKEEKPYRIAVDVEASAPGDIVVARNALPGWRASLDDSAAPLLATPAGLIRIPVPAGRHELLLSYRPPGLLAGAALSLAGLMALAGILLLVPTRLSAGGRRGRSCLDRPVGPP